MSLSIYSGEFDMTRLMHSSRRRLVMYAVALLSVPVVAGTAFAQSGAGRDASGRTSVPSGAGRVDAVDPGDRIRSIEPTLKAIRDKLLVIWREQDQPRAMLDFAKREIADAQRFINGVRSTIDTSTDRAARAAAQDAAEAASAAAVAEPPRAGKTPRSKGDTSGMRKNQGTDATEASREAVGYADEASREASEAADAASRALHAFPPNFPAIRRETNRARAAAERAWEAVDEAKDRPAKLASAPVVPASLQGARRNQQAGASFLRGSALLEAHSYQQARDHFAEAVALSPAHDEARAMLGWSEYFQGDFRGATITFKSALKRQPTWEGLYNGLGWSRLRLRRYHLAAAAFRSALDRNPDYADASNGLGSALFERGDYEAALPLLEKALHESQRPTGVEPPEVTILRGKIAWSLYYLKREREALAMFVRASLAAPASNEFQVGMGWCYLKLGQNDDAREAFERAMRLGPTDEAVREGLRRAGL